MTYGTVSEIVDETQPTPTECCICDTLTNDSQQESKTGTTLSAYDKIKWALAKWGGYREDKLKKSVVIIDGERLDLTGDELITTLKDMPVREISRYCINPHAPKEYKSKGYLIIIDTKKK